MEPYKDCTIYGPYLRLDNRYHIIAIDKQGKRTTVSFPKYLLEKHLGRYLDDNEEVHHLDNDLNNNSLENLVILPKDFHKSLPKKHFEEVWICANCGKSFIATSAQVRNRISNIRRGKAKSGPFCSRSCNGKVNH